MLIKITYLVTFELAQEIRPKPTRLEDRNYPYQHADPFFHRVVDVDPTNRWELTQMDIVMCATLEVYTRAGLLAPAPCPIFDHVPTDEELQVAFMTSVHSWRSRDGGTKKVSLHQEWLEFMEAN